MKFPTFSRRPEQMSLFKIPPQLRMKSWLKSLAGQILLLAVIIVEFVKVLRLCDEVIFAYRIGYIPPNIYRESHDFFWLLWLVSLLLVLHFVRNKRLFDDPLANWYVRLTVVVALCIFIIELASSTALFVKRYPILGMPWSYYVLLSGLTILVLWKLPAVHLAQWKDKLEVKDYLTILNGTRTILLQVIGGGIVIFGLYYTSQNINIAQENVRFAQSKEEADRLNQAITQLKDESPEVRLVAIYTLQGSALASTSNYRLITQIFKRYVRVHAALQDTQDHLRQEDVALRGDIQLMVSFLGDWARAAFVADKDRYGEVVKTNNSAVDIDAVQRFIGAVDFHATDLQSLDISYGFMRGWNLSSANLEKTSLYYSDLSGAVLDGANLSEVDLTRATLNSASLKGANLFKANLQGVSLQGADIEGADLTEAINLTVNQLKAARNYDKAKLPPAILGNLKSDTQ